MLQVYRDQIEAVMIRKIPREKGSKRPSPWKLIACDVTDSAYRYGYRVPSGYAFQDIEGQVDAFFAACGAVVMMKDKAGAVEIHVLRNEFPDKIMYLDEGEFEFHYPNGSTEIIRADHGKDWTLLMGFNIEKKPIYHDFRVLHGMYAGQSQYGKTTFLKWLMWLLINRFTPEELEIRIIDMKQTSYKEFRDIPHVTEICRTLPNAAAMLDEAHKEMQRRGDEIYEKDLDYSSFKRILIIIDEGAELSPEKQSNRENRKLANVAWSAAGSLGCVGSELRFGVWFCTQRPDSDTINPQLKGQVDMVTTFKVKTESNSKIVLDRTGAEKLPHGIPGRAIFSTTEDVTIQAPFIPKERLKELLAPYERHDGSKKKERPLVVVNDTGDDDTPNWEGDIPEEFKPR